MATIAVPTSSMATASTWAHSWLRLRHGRIRGYGFDTGSIRGDGFGTGGIHGDGFKRDAIQGDGYESLAAKAETPEPGAEPDVASEPWSDLSGFTGVQSLAAAPVQDDDAHVGVGFSPLELRDRVVIMLLFKQIVKIDEVERAYRRWRKESGGKSKDPFRRVLTTDSAFDRDQIFAEAAQVYAFKRASVDKKAAAAFIKNYKDTFAETFWERMPKLRVLPIRQETQIQTKEKRLIFVSHDPSRPDVNRLMRELRLDSLELQYAPESDN